MSKEPRELKVDEKQEVKYVIPNWLRDEQVKLSTARVKDRIQPVNEPRPEPVAVVGFAPSLNDTWEKIREFKYIITCSGSHKFLIERGIVPTWHVEVDPRPHKVALLGTPHPDVTYLPASTCHPEYFDHLEKHNAKVKLWHVFDATDDGIRLLPPGEWAITGGCDVGLRSLTIAGFLGFRELHVFGMDGCAKGQGEQRHAADHPYGKQPYCYCDYKGVRYWTTPAMLEAARQVFHELDQMPKLKATFYGNGLIQEMAKDYVPKWKEKDKPFSNVVGFSRPELISASYRELNERLHKDNLAYGVGGSKHADTVIRLVNVLKKECDTIPSVLDYGCGKGYLAKALPFPIAEYDPAVVGKNESPRAADLVICTDVLEHIEPKKLPFVLDDLRRCVKQVGFFSIHTGAAQKTLADGRNTHLIQRGKKWWMKRLAKFFVIGKAYEVPPEVYFVVGKRITRRVTAQPVVEQPVEATA